MRVIRCPLHREHDVTTTSQHEDGSDSILSQIQIIALTKSYKTGNIKTKRIAVVHLGEGQPHGQLFTLQRCLGRVQVRLRSGRQ